VTAVALIERLLDAAGRQRWDELPSLLAADYEIVEPDSLPYGGTHRGTDGYVALMERIGALFELGFDLDRVDAVGDDIVLVRMDVTFTARSTRRSVAMPVLELLTLRAGRIARSEVFLKDTAALLATLETSAKAAYQARWSADLWRAVVVPSRRAAASGSPASSLDNEHQH
jgi:ketosteroid isomerase-like protein